MKVSDSRTFKFHFRSKESTGTFGDGSPGLSKADALSYAETIHQLFTGKGLTYIQIWFILHLVSSTFEEERDIKTL